jgi:hypothetical protein
MDYRLQFAKPWPYRDPKHGRTTLPAGIYAVPGDLPHVVAERALAEGVARRIEVPMGREFPLQRGVFREALEEAAAKKAKAPRRSKKALGPAPENKSALV